MGNVVSELNNDGQNSQQFLGNYHNVGSKVANFSSSTVNFTGTNQDIIFSGSGQKVTYEPGSTVIYNTQPTFSKGVIFKDPENIKVGGSQLFKDGLIDSKFIPQSKNYTNIENLSAISITGTNINSTELISGVNITATSITTKNIEIEDTINAVNINSSSTINGVNIIATSITGANLYGNLIGKDVTANSLLTTTVGSTSGPSGGLQISGKNNWILGENSAGQLCFYNLSSGLNNATTTPFVCISATGFLIKGTA